ncbi:MAG: DNA alkylation repair protein [Candidatus Thorarchaeota archaeon]
MKEKILLEIKEVLKRHSPNLMDEKKSRMYKIINPDTSNYIIYGIKIANIEKIIKDIDNKYKSSYSLAVEIFKDLSRSNIEEQKFAGLFYINRYKKFFDIKTINLFKIELLKHCHTWSYCDSTCIRVLGPFLGKKGNEALAKRTIDDWASKDNIWIRRASMVILLKIIMLKKTFNIDYVFNHINKMLNFIDQNYIEKAIGWLLKTCSKYKPEIIFDYLMLNKDVLSRLILRYASEKLPKDKRIQVLKK